MVHSKSVTQWHAIYDSWTPHVMQGNQIISQFARMLMHGVKSSFASHIIKAIAWWCTLLVSWCSCIPHWRWPWKSPAAMFSLGISYESPYVAESLDISLPTACTHKHLHVCVCVYEWPIWAHISQGGPVGCTHFFEKKIRTHSCLRNHRFDCKA